MPELTPSTREAARRIGITETALRKAEQTSRIAREPDGQWDIDKTRRRLIETADPVRSPLAGGGGTTSASDGTPFARLKVAQLALKVEAQRLALDETRRRLVDVTEANAALDEIGSTMRDALLNWPARVSGLIAAEISVDPHLLQTILRSHINDLLTEAADRFDPAGLGGDRSPQP
ncbi:hypothetical protein [Rubritepida flocculans]|uniref:hypothetical protein n=1 Tax=Rubritepida flocculans TaxID=182403 RepID=UPI0003FE71CC|nr:hypothetical protein [Rubritepida flocculans]